MSEIKPAELTTQRLLLWMPGAEHADEMLRYHDDNRSHLGRWAPNTPAFPDELHTLTFWRKRLARAWREYVDGRSARFAISWKDAEPRRIMGTVNLTEIIRGPHQSCLLGYGLDEHQQGKGIMTEALRAGIAFAWDTLALHRITANYMPSNERSGAVLKRLGFTVEGYARDYLFVNGAWRDHILTALINPNPTAPS